MRELERERGGEQREGAPFDNPLRLHCFVNILIGFESTYIFFLFVVFSFPFVRYFFFFLRVYVIPFFTSSAQTSSPDGLQGARKEQRKTHTHTQTGAQTHRRGKKCTQNHVCDVIIVPNRR